MCDSFIKSYYLQNDRDSDSITIRNHVFQKLKEGIEFLISIHCIIRKSMFSVVTLTWYGIHGIAQSVKEETNEEIELKNKPLYVNLFILGIMNIDRIDAMSIKKENVRKSYND